VNLSDDNFLGIANSVRKVDVGVRNAKCDQELKNDEMIKDAKTLHFHVCFLFTQLLNSKFEHAGYQENKTD
jgi:hypothetical protein